MNKLPDPENFIRIADEYLDKPEDILLQIDDFCDNSDALGIYNDNRDYMDIHYDYSVGIGDFTKSTSWVSRMFIYTEIERKCISTFQKNRLRITFSLNRNY